MDWNGQQDRNKNVTGRIEKSLLNTQKRKYSLEEMRQIKRTRK